MSKVVLDLYESGRRAGHREAAMAITRAADYRENHVWADLEEQELRGVRIAARIAYDAANYLKNAGITEWPLPDDIAPPPPSDIVRLMKPIPDDVPDEKAVSWYLGSLGDRYETIPETDPQIYKFPTDFGEQRSVRAYVRQPPS